MAIYIRSTLNKHPMIAVGVCIVGVILLIFYVRSEVPHKAAEPTTFYTTDDGATYFGIAEAPVSPAKVDGKLAYHVNLFKSSKGLTFVGFMDRYSDKAKAAIDATGGNFSKAGYLAFTNANDVKTVKDGFEVKHPGDKSWTHIEFDNPSLYLYSKTVKSPDGGDCSRILPTDDM